ncbi:MAG: metalloregulator ArsR/SmtB family transcription factor [Pseudomonadota bacterium]
MDPELAAESFAAMGATTRLDVVRNLVRAGERGLTVGEIKDRTGLPASTLAHHLKTLSQAGLIVQERKGREIISRANYAHLQRLAGFILEECCVDAGSIAPLTEDETV